jgi:hypothetical protein
MALAGLAACALAVGGIVYALTPGHGIVPDNFIGAGHLVLHLNNDQGSDLHIGNLMPGEAQRGDQLITADLAGIGTADLMITLSGRPTGPFSAQTSLTLYYSDPEPAGGIDWDGSGCTPVSGYVHQVSYPNLAVLAHDRTSTLGTLTVADDGMCVRFEIELGGQAGNNVQRASAEFAMNYILQQTSAGPS